MEANIGPNVGASNFVSDIIRRINDEADQGYVCKSTEEMLYKFHKFNKERFNLKTKGKQLFIGSMEIEKWFPNTIPVLTANEIRPIFKVFETPEFT